MKTLDPLYTPTISRTEMRTNLKRTLNIAKGTTVVDIGTHVIVSGEYFKALMKKMRSMQETMEITMDRKLYQRLIKINFDKLDEDLRLGKLASLGDTFDER